ncbi:MAG: hypothetical protein HRU76_11875 [Phycisphaeraceae bacterium]|nr:MAG: hypothetical protein HRU76_11875 [Phycisphaeraceae bacterium]
MIQRIRAIFRRGVFVPQDRCVFPEDSQVDLEVRSLLETEGADTRVHTQASIGRVLASIQSNPIPAGAPQLKREDLHERR